MRVFAKIKVSNSLTCDTKKDLNHDKINLIYYVVSKIHFLFIHTITTAAAHLRCGVVPSAVKIFLNLLQISKLLAR
jgi:hypothetical protein